MNLYYSNFAIPAGHMVPLIAETGGRLHPVFISYMKSVIETDLIKDGSTEVAWTPAVRSIFTSRLHSALVTISIAIARSVAISLIYGSTVLERSPPGI